MKKQKKCIDLVNKNYQSRLKDLREAYNNQNIDLSTWLSEYGLNWDYVVPNTFDNQEDGYYRWQLSWGGPSDEFRIYTDNKKNIQSVEYWYLDWFDGASITVNDEEIINIIIWQLDCDLTPIEHEEREVA
jgi:hypothetical protein